MESPQVTELVPASRTNDGKFAPGNKFGGGWASESRQNLRAVARLAQERSRQALDRLVEIMGSDDERCATAAATAILKVAGAFDNGREAALDSEVMARLGELIAQARAKREGEGEAVTVRTSVREP